MSTWNQVLSVPVEAGAKLKQLFKMSCFQLVLVWVVYPAE